MHPRLTDRHALILRVAMATLVVAVAASVALAEAPPPFLLAWGGYGSGAGQFASPQGITVGRDGYVYVTDAANYRICKFTPEGVFVAAWGSQGAGPGQFGHIMGVTTDLAGRVVVADLVNYRIQRFTSAGLFVDQFGSPGGGLGQFSSIRDVAVDASGVIYVADRENHRVYRFSDAGVFLSSIPIGGPTAVAIDGAGEIYVCSNDPLINGVVVFSPSGTMVRTWGGSGDTEGRFNTPSGIAIDASGNVFVSDLHNHRMQKFTRQGVFLTQWRTSGGSATFMFPHDVGADANGNVYVVNIGSSLIQKFGPAPTAASPVSWGALKARYRGAVPSR